MIKLSFLILCGDIATNTGPVKNPCITCSKPVARTQEDWNGSTEMNSSSLHTYIKSWEH